MYRIPGIIVIIHIHFNLLWCCDLDLPGTDVDCGRDKKKKMEDQKVKKYRIRRRFIFSRK